MITSFASGWRRAVAAFAVTAGIVAAPLAVSSASIHATSVDPDGVLRFGSPNDTSTWDPHKSGTSRDELLLFAVYDRLTHVTTDGSFRDGLAESWEFSDDGLAMDLHLRENLQFQDGTPLDAEAVRANLERAQTVEGSTVSGDLSSVESVEVIDDLTVRLSLSAPSPLLPEFLSGRAGAMISPAAFGDPDLSSRPVGAGMYRLTEYVRGDHATLERWDGYWQPGSQALQTLELRILLDPAARVNALLADEVDATHITTQDVDRVAGAGFAVDTSPTQTIAHFMFDWSSTPFDNADIRQALQYALDRLAFVAALEFGVGEPTFQPVVPTQSSFDPDLNTIFAHDADRARELVDGSGLSGDDLQIRLLTVQGSTWHQRGAELVQGQLEAVGFDVTIQPVDRAQASELLFGDSDEINAWFGDVGVFPTALRTMHYLYASDGGVQMAPDGLPELDEVIAAGLAATDAAERDELTRAANRIAVEGATSSLPLYYRVEPSALSDGVVGWRHTSSARTEFYGVGMTG